MAEKIVIIGAGPAGVTVVETLRTQDRLSPIVMLSAEPYPPYSPPAMADHFLTGSSVHLWRGTDWPERMMVDYRPGTRVIGIDVQNKRLELAGEGKLDYDKLVIASGGRLHAPLKGVELPGVENFKSLSAATSLVERVKSGQAHTALIVGAGFIGMEIALLLSELGVQVTQVEMLEQVMPAMLDAHTAEVALQIMRKRGVQMRLNTKAQAFVGNGKATGVELETGESLTADIYVAATGVRPNLDFLEGSGIEHRGGISVDECLRTNAEEVYAAGDAVETVDRLSGEIFVHANMPNAVEQGKVVGLNLLGYAERYAGAERMNSLKHLGLPILAVGLKQGDEVLRGRVNGGWRTLYLHGNLLVGFQLVGDIRAAGTLHTLLKRGDDLRRIKDRLLEPGFGQGAVVWAAAGGLS